MIIKKHGTKIGGIIAGIALVVGIIVFYVLWNKGEQLHRNKIEKTIESMGGQVEQITKVKLINSPFVDTMDNELDQKRGYDYTIYKILYPINGKQQTAWFRSINGPYAHDRETIDYYGNPIKEEPENKNIIKEYGERWIFE